MAGKLINIKQIYDQPLPEAIKIFKNAPDTLVNRRQLVHTYEVNRQIKYWATWFLLKAYSTESSLVQHWLLQKERLLYFLQMNEGTFRHQLKELVRMGLAQMMPEQGFRLINYADAARIMGIEYQGTYTVQYLPSVKKINKNGKRIPARQSFQYILRAEEFEREKEKQLHAIMRHMDENPLFFKQVSQLLCTMGADRGRLHEEDYFQERLLQLQIHLFKEGSELLQWTIDTVRADINRGVKKIALHHGYKSPQSASYLKKTMWRLGIVDVRKICVKSPERCRLYFPDEETGERREGYKWLQKEKITALFLTDQITPRYASTHTTSWRREVRLTA